MVIDPTSGPPGTEISVTGDGCVTKGDVEVVVDLLDTSDEVQDSEIVEPSSRGSAATGRPPSPCPPTPPTSASGRSKPLCRLELVEEAAVAPAPDPVPHRLHPPAPSPSPSRPRSPPPVEEPPAAAPVDACPTSRAEPGVRPASVKARRRLDGIGHVETDPLTGLVAATARSSARVNVSQSRASTCAWVMSSCVQARGRVRRRRSSVPGCSWQTSKDSRASQRRRISGPSSRRW